jgi:CDGSH-type Zn-finger protein
MSELKILKDGPILLSDDIKVVKADGTEFEGKGALCRCGHSANKPFCDGAHQAKEFKGEEQ